MKKFFIVAAAALTAASSAGSYASSFLVSEPLYLILLIPEYFISSYTT